MKRSDYLDEFFRDAKDRAEAQKGALTNALEIRRFEIDHYWKRAAYFWAFIAITFTAYGYLVLNCSVCSNSKSGQNFELAYLLACLGFLFSLGWYFVNRGSKAWQQNWESHVDVLEDEVIGNLYKTVIGEHRFWNLTGAYFFSVSKINQLLSLFVTLAWAILLGHMLFRWFVSNGDAASCWLVLAALAPIIGGAVLWAFGRTSFDVNRRLRYRRRVIDDVAEL